MDRQSDEIVAYYTDRYREDLRLAARPQARLERTRTLELLREYLPAPPARILDVGGGTGEYARALVALGYRVRLLDLVPAHVTQARAGHPTVDADVADARALPEPDDGYDATLLLGPLYHLPRRADRCRALAEAVRVTRPGGRVLAAAISRFAGPLDFAATGRLDDRMVEEAAVLLTDGRNDARLGFTHAYFHRVEELLDECRTAGLVDLVVDGIEGPAWIAAEAAAHGPMAETVFTAALRLARVYRREPALVTASAHLLARGTVGDPSDIGRDRPDLRA
ncbi:class I SAM-dependent methyltransferase [Verrucosispora sp. WMMA2044]|uniref:class I SAM-dependent methyltransferase n=1 Tax=Verrucosispora sp. WMMA2044 TaxID=3016419 RepID=UPI00248BCA57|nr:class I SAM-dependent methyltransferase [Verrucosispora sp. WMMA2044]WBB50699.1 class I SAM-dependent methyltransferase [Verrucosispora sp. WMMA2044]